MMSEQNLPPDVASTGYVPHQPASPRSGVTLLEIMISIGVVGIGLIGVASLIPLAHFKAAEGVREERKALFGKRALRDFYAYEFDHVGTIHRPHWVRWRFDEGDNFWKDESDEEHDGNYTDLDSDGDDDGFELTDYENNIFWNNEGAFFSDGGPAIPYFWSEQNYGSEREAPGQFFLRYIPNGSQAPLSNQRAQGTSVQQPGEEGVSAPSLMPRYNDFCPAGELITQTYCFDPHGVAGSWAVAAPLASSRFPQWQPTTNFPIAIPRVTVTSARPEILREALEGNQKFGPQTAMDYTVFGAGGIVQPLPMSLARADEIFRLQDDLLFEVTDEVWDIQTRTKNPALKLSRPLMQRQQRRAEVAPLYLHNDQPRYINATYLKEGNFSWMATLVPDIARTTPPYVDAANQIPLTDYPVSATNRYRMSMVIFNQRDLLFNQNGFREECVARVMNPTIPSMATNPLVSIMQDGIKEVLLEELTPGDPQDERVGVRHINPGDWIALAQNQNPNAQFNNYSTGGSFGRGRQHLIQLKWYQVVTADEITPSGEIDPDTNQTVSGIDIVRRLTLSGPDWNVPRFHLWADALNDTVPGEVFAIYIPSVVAVYEKTIELTR